MDNFWSNLHADFIKTLFVKLNSEGIRYFVLRNHEELPENNNGKDVDVVIEPHKYNDVRIVLLETLKEHDIHYYTVTKFDRMRCWYIMDVKKKFGIHIDVIENEYYKGFEFYDFSTLYSHIKPNNGFYILDEIYDTALLLIQNLVAYKCLKPKYQETIRFNYQIYCKEINEVILDFWGHEVGGHLIELLTENNFEAIVDLAQKLESTAMKRIFIKRPFYTAKNILRFMCGKFYRVVWCPNKFWRFFAVEAPDGTGKTTFIDTLVQKLRFYYVSDPVRFQIHHFRPSILPNLGAAGEKTGLMKQDKDFTNPHRAESANSISSFIRMLYYWLDYIIGIPYLLRKEVQYERYTIFDRYIYDFVVDPKRSRINLPHWLRVLFSKFVVQPQIVFVLDADADVIYMRKQELTREEINRQLHVFRNLTATHKRFVRIDANKSPEEVADQAIKIIMDKFMNKL